MSLATALLTPILGDASPWTPRRLFQLGEAGGVYDPSDLTAEKVAWRRNLWLYSEPTSATGYTVTNATFTTNALFNFLPGGGACIELADATVGRSAGQTHTLTAGVTYTLSFYVTIAGGGLPNSGSGSYRDFTITRDNQDVTNYALITYDNLGGGVYRAKHTWLHTATGTAVRVVKYSGLNTNTAVRFTGIQLEVGPIATAYQRITDFTSDFLAAFPTHALYQDSAGTTPVTALGQPVGLVIDSKTGGLANLGPELVTNGDFSSGTLTGWHVGSALTASVVSGEAQVTFAGAISSTTNNWFSAGPIVDTGDTRTFYVEFDATWVSGGGSLQAGIGYNTRLTVAPNAGKTRYRIAGNNLYGGFGIGTVSGAVTFGATASATVWRIDNVSVKLIPGVHAIQPTSSSRPLLDGRVNLLTFSEQFDNAAWTKTNGTITANAAVAPDGTTTADAFIENTANGTHAVVQNITNLNSTTAAYKQEFVVKANGRTRVAIQFASAASGFPAIEGRWDLTTGTLTSSGATGTAVLQGTEINALGNGYYRISVTGYTGQSGLHYAQLFMLDASGNIVYTGDGASGIFVWGADHRLAADAAYPYQRVAAVTDYADVGVPRAFAFDGFDDSLYTASNMDLSGTDKVTVLAGVRKLSDVAIPVIVEHGPTSSTNVGFTLFGPRNTFTGDYGFRSTGALISPQDATTTAIYPAPITNVVTGIANIGGPSVLIRVNGTQAAVNTTTQGATNYLSTLLNVGRRNNASAPFNGKAYQLIVRGALTDTATLAQAERYVGAKTGLAI